MRTLTATLLQAQKSASAVPHVKVEVLDDIAGVVRPTFTRLYTGSETDFHHDATCPGDGSLVRARVDSTDNKLYVQRVASPGPTSDFSQWTLLGAVSGSSGISLVSLGANVHLFYVASDGKDMFRRISADYGATWSGAAHVLNPSDAGIAWLAAALDGAGTLVLFYVATSHNLYFTEYTGSYWTNPVSWTNAVGSITGVDSAYQGDWNLVVTGTESSSGDPKVWTCIYGDGTAQSEGTWSSLREVNTAKSGSDTSFHHPTLALPDVFRCFYDEKFTGTSAYQRPVHSHSLATASFADNLWREPVPFQLTCAYGTALAFTSTALWLSTPYGVWHGPMSSTGVQLTDDALEVVVDEDLQGGSATVVLRNDDGRYNSIGSGAYAALRKGSRLSISPGYVTTAGAEESDGPSYWVQGWEYRSSPGGSTFVLFAENAWRILETWWARRQYSWATGASSVADILRFVLARAGLELSTAGASGEATTLKPAFTAHPGESGSAVVRRLLAAVPDVLTFRAALGSLLEPLAADSTDYAYGTDHAVLQGRYLTRAQEHNRVQVFGSGNMGEAFAWAEVDQIFDRIIQVHDLNLDTAQKSQERADAVLRQQVVASLEGLLTAPANCGQELMDVIEITDPAPGLVGARRRVVGLGFRYSRGDKPRYHSTLSLGGV